MCNKFVMWDLLLKHYNIIGGYMMSTEFCPLVKCIDDEWCEAVYDDDHFVSDEEKSNHFDENEKRKESFSVEGL